MTTKSKDICCSSQNHNKSIKKIGTEKIIGLHTKDETRALGYNPATQESRNYYQNEE
jgi:hypothetical protein